MPLTQVKNSAEKYGTTVKKTEKKWKEATKAAEKSYGKKGKDIRGNKDTKNAKFYGTVNKIFKNKMKAISESEIMSFNEFKNNNLI